MTDDTGQPTVDRLAALEAALRAAENVINEVRFTGYRNAMKERLDDSELWMAFEEAIRAALDAASPLTGPVPDRTVEQRAWAIVHEEGPTWWNWYSRKYPNSKADEHQKRESMAHSCVVAALKQAVVITPTPDQGALERVSPDFVEPPMRSIARKILARVEAAQAPGDDTDRQEAWSIIEDALTAAASEARAGFIRDAESAVIETAMPDASRRHLRQRIRALAPEEKP